MTKLCTGCGEIKPLDCFTKDSKRVDGKAHKCRSCAKAIHDRWLAEHPNYGANQQRRRRAARTPEQHAAENEEARLRAERKSREAGRATRAERIAAQKAEAARIRALPPPAVKVCCACKVEKPIEAFNVSRANADGRTARCRACASDAKALWAQSRTEWLAAYDREYRANNEDVIATNGRRRRARMLNAPGEDHTPEQVAELWKLSGGVCANLYCRKPIAKGARHLDHIVPLARGGSNAISNLQFLCPTCNHQKHAKMPDEWQETLERRLIAKILA